MENIDEGGHGTKTNTNFGRGEGKGVLGVKFLIQRHVDEICSQFGIFDDEEREEEEEDTEEKEGRRKNNRYAETSAAVLANMVSEFSVTRGVSESSRRRLLDEAAKRGNEEKFESLYEALKRSNAVPELDRWNAVVAKIAADEELKEAVKSRDSSRKVSERSPVRATKKSSPRKLAEEQPASTVLKALREMTFDKDSAAAHIIGENDRPYGEEEKEEEEEEIDEENGRARQRQQQRVVKTTATSTSAATTRKPTFPSWNEDGSSSNRPYLTSNFLGIEYERDVDTIPLASRSTAEQELLLLDDFLHAALGLDGRYVTARRAASMKATTTKKRNGGNNDDINIINNNEDANRIVKFECESGCEPSLRELLGRMLPMCEDAFACSRFVEKTLYGQTKTSGKTSKALATEVRDLLGDWERMIAQLERKRNKRDLSLQSAYFYARPAAEALRLLASVSFACENEMGGKLLNTLRRLKIRCGGDSEAERLLTRLENATAKSYLKRLEKWMSEGDCENDTYEEFFVVEDKRLKPDSLSERFDNNNAYWTEKYVPREPTPWFLDDATKVLALNAGKYVNALREITVIRSETLSSEVTANGEEEGIKSIVVVDKEEKEKERKKLSFSNISDVVRAKHDVSNKHFFDALLLSGDIRNKLQLVKATFLLAQGDYLSQFFDSPFKAFEELEKPAKFCDEQKLRDALEVSMKNSSMYAFKYHQDIKCALEKNISTSNDARGLETFTLDYKTSFPANVVLSKSTIAKYQALFKHLFRAKVMEKKVCETWATLRRLHKKMHRRQQQQSSSRMEYENPAEEHFLTRDVFVHANAAHWTAQRAISLIQNVLHYATSEVIEPNWATMESEIFSSSTSADNVIKAHAKFLETTARESMLLRPTLLNVYESILQSCSKLCDACEDFERNDEKEEAKLRVVAGDYDDREDQMEDFLHRIEFISSEFDERTAAFIDALKDAARFESKFESLISRVEPLEQSNSRY
jgi:gamma-tubulin complex component 2